MMGIDLNIKAKSDNISILQIFELVQKYCVEKVKDKKIYELNGYKFSIEVEVNMSITYIITELSDLPDCTRNKLIHSDTSSCCGRCIDGLDTCVYDQDK